MAATRRQVRWWSAVGIAVLSILGTACSDDDAEPTLTTSPTPVTATTVPGTPPPPRVLLVGDSTLLAVQAYSAFGAFTGFEAVYDAESCRTIGIPSCNPGRARVPNVVETIVDADGQFDAIVIMAGYDEWWTSFPGSFDDAVAAARDKGATEIVWLTYTEGVGYVAPDGRSANEAFVKNNETLHAKVDSGEFTDVVLADWESYSSSRPRWFNPDGIHLTEIGAYGLADYISRKLAFVAELPCPMPREPGGLIDQVCPDPDLQGPVPDVLVLYD